MKYALEGDEPDEGERREEHQPEGVERGSDVARGRDEAEGDQAAGDRGEEHAGPTGRLGDRRAAGALQREVLCRHEGNGRRPGINDLRGH